MLPVAVAYIDRHTQRYGNEALHFDRVDVEWDGQWFFNSTTIAGHSRTFQEIFPSLRVYVHRTLNHEI